MTRDEWALWYHEFLYAVYGAVHKAQREAGVELDAYLDTDGVWKVRGDE